MEFLLGFVIALAISLTGVGAGSMTTPLLILLLGLSPATAVGTALAFGAIVKGASVPLYAIRRQVNLPILCLLLAGGVPGVIAGGLLLNGIKHSASNGVLYIALGTLIVATALFHLYRVFRPKLQPSNNNHSRLLPWCALLIGGEVGFSSAGAGALGSVLLLGLTPLTAAEVVGTDLCFGLGLSLVGSFIQIGVGNYDAPLLGKLLIGGLIGALAGSLLAGRIAQRPLRVGLLLALVILGCRLALYGSAPVPRDGATRVTRPNDLSEDALRSGLLIPDIAIYRTIFDVTGQRLRSLRRRHLRRYTERTDVQT